MKFLISNSKFLINLLILLGLVLPGVCLAQEQYQFPKTLEEVKDFGLRILEKLPEAVKRTWQEEVWPLWQRMWNWVWPRIEPWWHKFLDFLGKEVEKRKPIIEEELRREKEELKEELPRVGESLWERFKELLK